MCLVNFLKLFAIQYKWLRIWRSSRPIWETNRPSVKNAGSAAGIGGSLIDKDHQKSNVKEQA